MSYTYARREYTGDAVRDARPARGPQLGELAAGARPTPEQVGSRVDLPGEIREKMESSFGADFSHVKLYESDTVAQAGAEAVTQGNTIAFAPGKLDLASTAGQALLGHELSHVVSQSRGESAGRGFLNDARLEAQADRQGMLAAQGESVYQGPVSPIGVSSAVTASGPMQAKKGDKRAVKKKEELKSENFDELAQYSDRTGGLIYNLSMGTEKERREKSGLAIGLGSIIREQPDNIDMGEGKGKLKGRIFSPPRRGNGKHVILYSGSGMAAGRQIKDQVKMYVTHGYTVHVYDYRGYGESTFEDGKTQPSEKSMMEDATAVYEHVLKNGTQRGGNQGGRVNNANVVMANAETGEAAPAPGASGNTPAAGNAPAAGNTPAAPTAGNAPAVPAAGNAPAAGNTPAAPTAGNTPAVPAAGNAPAAPAVGNTPAVPRWRRAQAAQAAPQPLTASDILLHGFSMGGVAASHVARHAAIRASKSGKESDKLGGLVLESSMRNFGNAAVGMGLPKFMEALAHEHGKKGMGEFDTEANLRETAKLDRELPVTFLTGSRMVYSDADKKYDKGDHLAEENTHLAQDLHGVFNKAQVARDEAYHLDQGKLRNKWDEIAEHLMR